MKYFYLITLSIFTLFSCKNEFSQSPNEEAMKKCLSNYFSDKIKIGSYQHLDGLQKERDGVKYYESYFNAEIKFISNYEDFRAGDEYKVLKGVLLFMKTEKGWNCQEFDFSKSELIKINKFETNQENHDTKTSESNEVENKVYKSQNTDYSNNEQQIKNIINNYYDAIANKDFNEFYNLFSSSVNFFGKPNYSVDKIIAENNAYQNRWPFYEVNLDGSSFEINPVGDKTDVKYRIFYKVKRKQEDNWKIFDLKMKMIFNRNMQIESVNEYKQ